jgi:hypothetical protein
MVYMETAMLLASVNIRPALPQINTFCQENITNCFRSRYSQYCGSVRTDPDTRIRTDPALFVSGMPTKNKFQRFFCLLRYFLKVHLNKSSNIKSQKEVSDSYPVFFLLIATTSNKNFKSAETVNVKFGVCEFGDKGQ